MTNVLRGLALVAKGQSTDDETCRFHEVQTSSAISSLQAPSGDL